MTNTNNTINIICQPTTTSLETCRSTKKLANKLHKTEYGTIELQYGWQFVKKMQEMDLPAHHGVTPEKFFKGTVLMSKIDKIKKIAGYQRFCPGLEEILYQLEIRMDLSGKIPEFKVEESTDNGYGDRRTRDQDYYYIQLSTYGGYAPGKWLCIKES